jgi:cysteine-rich repeat protein
VSCACTAGGEGVQTCEPGGTYGTCDCGGGNTGGGGGGGGGSGGAGGGEPCNHGALESCGNGNLDPGEQCDDGNCVDNDACTNTCTTPICGDKIVQAGEDCDDGNDENGTCPNDCKINSCAGKLIFSDFTAQMQTSQWAYQGKLGIDAGTEMCKAIGAADVCDYEQLKEVLTNPGMHAADIAKMTAKVPASSMITVWVNRTTPERVTGVMSAPGAGGRCNEWVYKTNHISDGEYLTLTNTAGALSGAFTLDQDTVYTGVAGDGHAGAGLDCGGQQRYIACCFPVCKP